ncbi:MAG: gamma-butyrobetaine hydroxylase family protein [Acidiphilium sp.]
MTAPEPTEIRLRRAERTLEVTFADGTHYDFPAEYLRVESPSAEVQGHSPTERQLVAGKRRVGIAGLEPNGHYAVRIKFDDGHSTGIYSWDYLHRLGREQPHRWAAYLAALTAAGLSRD